MRYKIRGLNARRNTSKRPRGILSFASFFVVIAALVAVPTTSALFSVNGELGTSDLSAAFLGATDVPATAMPTFRALRQNDGSCKIYYDGLPENTNAQGALIVNNKTKATIKSYSDVTSKGTVIDASAAQSAWKNVDIDYTVSTTRGGWYSHSGQNKTAICGSSTITDNFNNLPNGGTIDDRKTTTGQETWETDGSGNIVGDGSGGVTARNNSGTTAWVDTEERTDGKVEADISSIGGDGVTARQSDANNYISAFLYRDMEERTTRELLMDRRRDNPYHLYDKTTTTKRYDWTETITQNWYTYNRMSETLVWQPTQWRREYVKKLPVTAQPLQRCVSSATVTSNTQGLQLGTSSQANLPANGSGYPGFPNDYWISDTGAELRCNPEGGKADYYYSSTFTAHSGGGYGMVNDGKNSCQPTPLVGEQVCWVTYRTTYNKQYDYRPVGSPTTTYSTNLTCPTSTNTMRYTCGAPIVETTYNSGGYVDVPSCISSDTSAGGSQTGTWVLCSQRIKSLGNVIVSANLKYSQCTPSDSTYGRSSPGTIITCPRNPGYASVTYSQRSGLQLCSEKTSDLDHWYTMTCVRNDSIPATTVVEPQVPCTPVPGTTPSYAGQNNNTRVDVTCPGKTVYHQYYYNEPSDRHLYPNECVESAEKSMDGEPLVACIPTYYNVTYQDHYSDISWGQVENGNYSEWNRKRAGYIQDRGEMKNGVYEIWSRNSTGKVPVTSLGIKAVGDNLTLHVNKEAAAFDTKTSVFNNGATGWGIVHTQQSPQQGSRFDNFMFGLPNG